MELIVTFFILLSIVGCLLLLYKIKGDWGEAIIALTISPLIMGSLWGVAYVAYAILGAFFVEVFFPVGAEGTAFKEILAFWGATLTVTGLFTLYCIQAKHGATLKRGPALGGSSSRGYGGTAKGAWRNESVGIFRRKF